MRYSYTIILIMRLIEIDSLLLAFHPIVIIYDNALKQRAKLIKQFVDLKDTYKDEDTINECIDELRKVNITIIKNWSKIKHYKILRAERKSLEQSINFIMGV